MSKETKIVSKITKNSCLDSQLYGFISDFRNIVLLLPPEFREKVQCTQTTVTMEAMPGVTVTLHILEQEPYSLLKLGAAESAREFCIWIQLKQVAPYDTRIRITLHADLPMAAKMFGKGKLQKFVDGFADALAQIPVYALQGSSLN